MAWLSMFVSVVFLLVFCFFSFTIEDGVREDRDGLRV
jgi:hypothetical protein